MIVGKRIRFRAIEEHDLGDLHEWLNDPEISHLVGGWSFPVSMASQREWFKHLNNNTQTQRWIVETNDGVRLGLTGLWEIDWHNSHALTALKLGSPDARGRGYGTEAIMMLMSYAFFEVGLRRLWTEILPYNKGSYRAYVEKCGWRVEGVHREHIFRDGTWYDQIALGVLRHEFEAFAAASDFLPTVSCDRVEIKVEHLAIASIFEP